jgi:hypothetical protein
MKPQELFGVVVRTIGVALMATAATSVLGIFDSLFAIVGIAIPAGVGAGLFFKADQIVEMAYGRSESVRD